MPVGEWRIDLCLQSHHRNIRPHVEVERFEYRIIAGRAALNPHLRRNSEIRAENDPRAKQIRVANIERDDSSPIDVESSELIRAWNNVGEVECRIRRVAP